MQQLEGNRCREKGSKNKNDADTDTTNTNDANT